MDVIKGYCVYTHRYIQGTYKWYVRGRGNKDKHEAFHGYAVCISLILGSTLQSYPWYIAVLVGETTKLPNEATISISVADSNNDDGYCYY